MNDEFDILSNPDDELEHYGTPRHSGRYPWGSGDNPYQHRDEKSVLRSTYRKNETFLNKINEMMGEGVPEKDIAKEMGFKTTTELRSKRKAASNTNKKIDISEIQRLEEKGYSTAEIARRLEKPYSTIVSLKKPGTQENVNRYSDTMDRLKEEVANKKYIYVGKGAEAQLGITPDHLNKALKELEAQGYTLVNIKAEQVTNPGNYTTMQILAPPGEDLRSVSKHRDEIKPITESPTADKDAKVFGIERPVAVDSKRIYIRYPDDPTGDGSLQDGTIQIRRGVDDLYLGPHTTYAQVRVNVDDKSYLKGMALYGGEEDIPDGYDIVFNTSKKRGADVYKKIFKELKKVDENDPNSPVDWDNPFGAAIKSKDEGGQYHYLDKKTGEWKLSPINKVNDEGDWNNWSVTLSSQFLSKQPAKLIKQQLDKTYDIRKKEFQELLDLPDSPVKEYLLKEFAGSCDSAAVHLKAEGFKGQGQKVILPLNSLNPGEIYAPSYTDGTRVILVRHPHQGTFEIPVLTVNNRDKKGQEVLGNVQDAVGIRGETAMQLSGADYDGDTVSVIPVTGIEKDFKIEKAIKDLQFDPKAIYAKGEGEPKTGKEREKGGRKFNKGREMGGVSNLITDMTLQNAPQEDVIKATRHALVVIDAEKHNLDWVQSEIDNDIKELKRKYQGGPNKGAATLISRAKGTVYVDDRDPNKARIDPETGEVIYYNTHKMSRDRKTGELKPAQQKSTKMGEAKDARTLISDGDYPQEELYAEYANNMKAMANQARKASLNMGYTQNPGAAETFAREVASLNAKLNTAIKNKPYESLAQLKANAVIYDKRQHMSKDLTKEEKEKQMKKIRTQAMNAARTYWGAEGGKSKIPMTEREWQALNSGAFTKNKVNEILKNTKSEVIKNYALPKESYSIDPGLRALIYTMNNASSSSGGQRYTLADISERTGLSTSVVSDVLRDKI